MKTVILIQARMTSTRLPGKVLKKTLGKSLLEYLVERLRLVTLVDELCVATTINKTDDPIIEECKRLGVRYFRGSENNVLERYYQAALDCNAQNIVRVTSDCPVIDPREIDRLILFFKENSKACDYASNSLVRTYPRGMDAEIFTFKTLETAHQLAKSDSEREHVTLYIYQNPEQFRIHGIQYESDQSHYRWTVDTEEDFVLVSKIIETLYPKKRDFSLKDMLEAAAVNPDWKTLNSHVRQKKIPVKTLTTGDTTFYQFDPLLGFWGVPNIEREIENLGTTITIRHNDYGNRDYPFDPSKKEKTILCLGGSHSWGAGIELNQLYTSRLAEQTGKRGLHLGQCSLGMDQICVLILEKAKFYNPTTIIIEQYPWALHRILSTYVNGYVKPYFYLDADKKLQLTKVPKLMRFPFFRRILGSFHSYRKELQEFKGGIDLKSDYNPANDPVYLYWKLQYYEYMYLLADKILNVLRDFCRQNNIKLLFALGTVLQQFGPQSKSKLVDYELPKKKLIMLLDKHQIPYVDTSTDMLGEHSTQDPVIFSDGHINAKGHSVFAKVLQKDLQARGWINA